MPKNAYQKQVWDVIKAFLGGDKRQRYLVVFHDCRNKYARVKICHVDPVMRHKDASLGALFDWLDERDIRYRYVRSGPGYHGTAIYIPNEEGGKT